jgi:hypothetical protein
MTWDSWVQPRNMLCIEVITITHMTQGGQMIQYELLSSANVTSCIHTQTHRSMPSERSGRII